MDKIDKFFTLSLFTAIGMFIIDSIVDILRESNARLVSDALHTSIIISVVGYNEFIIIGGSIIFGFVSALMGMKLSQFSQNTNTKKEHDEDIHIYP